MNRCYVTNTTSNRSETGMYATAGADLEYLRPPEKEERNVKCITVYSSSVMLDGVGVVAGVLFVNNAPETRTVKVLGKTISKDTTAFLEEYAIVHSLVEMHA